MTIGGAFNAIAARKIETSSNANYKNVRSMLTGEFIDVPPTAAPTFLPIRELYEVILSFNRTEIPRTKIGRLRTWTVSVIVNGEILENLCALKYFLNYMSGILLVLQIVNNVFLLRIDDCGWILIASLFYMICYSTLVVQ